MSQDLVCKSCRATSPHALSCIHTWGKVTICAPAPAAIPERKKRDPLDVGSAVLPPLEMDPAAALWRRPGWTLDWLLRFHDGDDIQTVIVSPRSRPGISVDKLTHTVTLRSVHPWEFRPRWCRDNERDTENAEARRTDLVRRGETIPASIPDGWVPWLKTPRPLAERAPLSPSTLKPGPVSTEAELRANDRRWQHRHLAAVAAFTPDEDGMLYNPLPTPTEEQGRRRYGKKSDRPLTAGFALRWIGSVTADYREVVRHRTWIGLGKYDEQDDRRVWTGGSVPPTSTYAGEAGRAFGVGNWMYYREAPPPPLKRAPAGEPWAPSPELQRKLDKDRRRFPGMFRDEWEPLAGWDDEDDEDQGWARSKGVHRRTPSDQQAFEAMLLATGLTTPERNRDETALQRLLRFKDREKAELDPVTPRLDTNFTRGTLADRWNRANAVAERDHAWQQRRLQAEPGRAPILPGLDPRWLAADDASLALIDRLLRLNKVEVAIKALEDRLAF